MLRIALPLVLAMVLSTACAEDDVHMDDDHGASAAVTEGFEEAYAQVELGKEDSAGCSGVVVPDTSGFGKRVALTFDDGPNAATTPRVLDILAEHGIKATFFINGSRVKGETERAILRRIIAEGHILGNHSQDHIDLKKVTAAKLDTQVDTTDTILRAAGVTPRYFRFPFGSASCAGLELVKGRGYAATGWHVDSADWCFASSSGYCRPASFKYVPDAYRRNMLGYVLSQVKAKNGGIVLFHDIHANTVAHLDEILSEMENEGFAFVRVDDTTVFPKLNGTVAPPAKWVGDVCATSAECNFSSAAASAECHRFTPAGSASEVGFCTVACEGFCPDKTGRAATFCTSLDGGFTGRCVSKAAAQNQLCAGIAGTAATLVSRFIGTSSAGASTATVCLPK